MTPNENPSVDPVQEKSSECQAQPASADPSAPGITTSRRGFLKAGGALSMSSLMGTAALMVQSDDAEGSRLEAEGLRRRNATVTTIAPTGTISILADCSAGIEPLYGISVVHTIMEEIRLERLHPEFLKRAKARGLPLATLRREVGRHESIQHLSLVPEDLRRLFLTAHDIAPEHHVRMQAVFQRHSDSGVSKTINLPPTATTKDVAAAFILAHELGCKGLTVYRSGSREHQVLSCSHVQSC